MPHLLWEHPFTEWTRRGTDRCLRALVYAYFTKALSYWSFLLTLSALSAESKEFWQNLDRVSNELLKRHQQMSEECSLLSLTEKNFAVGAELHPLPAHSQQEHEKGDCNVVFWWEHQVENGGNVYNKKKYSEGTMWVLEVQAPLFIQQSKSYSSGAVIGIPKDSCSMQLSWFTSKTRGIKFTFSSRAHAKRSPEKC